jgi:hypothetical protein
VANFFGMASGRSGGHTKARSWCAPRRRILPLPAPRSRFRDGRAGIGWPKALPASRVRTRLDLSLLKSLELAVRVKGRRADCEPTASHALPTRSRASMCRVQSCANAALPRCFWRIEQQSVRLLSALIRCRPAKHRPMVRREKPDHAMPVRSARAAAAMPAAGLCRLSAARG